jgi:hypothetical protein
MVGPAASCALSYAASFSACGHYRWWLQRVWAPERPRLLFLGLNPSLADAQRDDPTLRRILGFARRWGYGAVEVLNLFARVSASPGHLRRCDDPVGPENDAWLAGRLGLGGQQPAVVWLAWGNQGARQQRDQQVLAVLAAAAVPMAAIALTQAGQPRHPLYAPGDARLWPLVWHKGEALRHPVDSQGPVASPIPWPAPHGVTPCISTSVAVKPKPCTSKPSMRFSSGTAGS